jgi:hypothetical protein
MMAWCDAGRIHLIVPLNSLYGRNHCMHHRSTPPQSDAHPAVTAAPPLLFTRIQIQTVSWCNRRCAFWVVYTTAADNPIGVKTGYNALISQQFEGHCHGATPVLLPTRSVGHSMALRHVASQLAQAKRAPASRASHTHQAQAQAFYRAQSVRGSDAQASLCPV